MKRDSKRKKKKKKKKQTSDANPDFQTSDANPNFQTSEEKPKYHSKVNSTLPSHSRELHESFYELVSVFHIFFLMETLQLLNYTSSFTIRNSLSRKKKNKKEAQLQLQRRRRNLQIITTTTKSTPTPLLIRQTPYTETKYEALDAVLKDIEISLFRGIIIDAQIFSSLLETCFQMQSIHHGIQVHNLIPPTLLRKSVSLSSKLLRLYASFGLVDKAHQIFDEMPKRSTSAFPWNSLISGYTEMGQYDDAMAIYFQMEEEGIEPDQFTFPRVLKACAGLRLIRVGEAIHRDIVRSGFAYDGFVQNALVDMYAKCGDILKARRVFENIVHPDKVSWNSMLTSYIRHGLLLDALNIFRKMLRAGFDPDSVAISTILTGFSTSKLGGEIHGWVLRRGLANHLSIANSLIAVYSEQGKLDRARWLFSMMEARDVISWNSIISSHRNSPEALLYFQLMENSGVSPDSITFVSILAACAHQGLVEDGRQIFVKMKKDFRIKPQMEHYACMVNLLGRAGLMISEAYEIIVKKMEFEAGATVWGALL